MYVREDHTDPNCVYYGRTEFWDTPTSDAKWQIWREVWDGTEVIIQYANSAKYNQIWDDRATILDTEFGPCPAAGTPPPGSVDTNVVNSFVVELFDTGPADTDKILNIPQGTKRFTLKNRGNRLVKIAHAAGLIATNVYFSVEPGTTYDEAELKLNAAGLDIYIQSVGANEILEVLKWS